MKLTSLGAGNEVGRSAFVVEDKSRILLDYGVKIFTRGNPPQYPLNPGKIDAAIISHAHLDHIGYLPALYKERKVPWYSTPITYDIGEVMWYDSIKIAKINNEKVPFNGYDIKKAYKNWNPLVYGMEDEIKEFVVKFYDASHIAGSAMIELYNKEKRILYTGDLKMSPTEMHSGAKEVETDVLIIEGTYYYKDHPPRKEVEKQLMEEIKETIEEGGSVLLPSFALGRTQELLKVVRKYDKDVPVYIDGMGKRITKIYLKFPGYYSDFKGFEKAVQSVKFVETPKQREKALREPSVIISTAGMLEGGPALYYITRLNPKSKIILTGYCVEGTNGRNLLEKQEIEVDGYKLAVDIPVKFIDFSAHCGREEVIRFAEKSNAEKIIIVHSDNGKGFGEELKEKGFDAYGITTGETIEI